VSRSVPDRARTLAAELALRFAQDAQLTTRLNNAHRRLQRANERLWSGLHPDGIAAVYKEHPTAVEAAAAHNRSEILDAPDPLREAQRAHWTIHRALIDCHNATECRRQLAVEVGELAGELVATLVSAGWSEQDARNANVVNLVNAREPRPGTAS
jgi:hypothetical protein